MGRQFDRSWVDNLTPEEIRSLEESAIDAPTVDALGLAVGYSDRAPGDYIVSGPIGAAGGPGRCFDDLDAARAWVVVTYGSRLKGEVRCQNVTASIVRWYALIRPK